MRCSLTEHILPLKEPLVTAMGPIARRLVWVVAIEDDVGRVGLGEAAPLPVFGGEDPPTCAEVLNQALPLLSDDVVLGWTERGRPDAAIGRLEHLFAHAPCARSAVEGALIDLLAQRRGESLAEVLAGGPALEQVPVNCLIAGTIPDIEAQVERALAAGFRTFKLKVGGDVFADGKRLQVLRSLIGPDARIRIDGNGAWDLEQARFFLTTARDSAVEFCEQPLREHDLEGMATLRKSGGVALAIDEGIRQPTDVARVAAAQAADIIVLKPMFLGGWRPTLQAAQLAQANGLDVVLTSVIDGAIGRAHATHMAAALGLAKRAHGLATGDLLAADLVTAPLQPVKGAVVIPSGPGLGVGGMLGRAKG